MKKHYLTSSDRVDEALVICLEAMPDSLQSSRAQLFNLDRCIINNLKKMARDRDNIELRIPRNLSWANRLLFNLSSFSPEYTDACLWIYLKISGIHSFTTFPFPLSSLLQITCSFNFNKYLFLLFKLPILVYASLLFSKSMELTFKQALSEC